MLLVAGIMAPGEFFVGINAYVNRGNLVDTKLLKSSLTRGS